MKKEKQAKPEIFDDKKENKFLRNYAEDIDTCDRWWDMVKGMIAQTRWDRRQKENQWLEDQRQWACNLTDSSMYFGRANLFIPEFFHQVENTVSKYVSGMLPSENYIGARSKNGTPDDIVEDIRAAVYDQINFKNKAPVLFDRHGRQRTIFGTSPLRPIFKKKDVPVYFRKGKDVCTKIQTQCFVEWKLIDMYRWYIYPEFATMDDCFMCFEDDWIPKRVLEDAKINGKPMYTALDDINEIQEDFDDHQWIDVQRLMANTIAQAASLRPKAVYTTTVYMDFDIEGDGNWVPCVGCIANNGTVIRLARNPFWFQKAPYVVGRYVQWPTQNFYGLSLSDRIRSLCRWQTDVANQTMDSLVYALAPIAIIDPALAGDPTSFVMQPGARWFGNPAGIDFKMMTDVSGVGWQGMSQVRNMIAQFSDNSTGIAPQLTGKARSATQASFVDREVSKDLRVSMLAEEADVTVPMCHMTHSMLRQYQTEQMQILSQGPEKGSWITKSVDIERLEGEVDFEWFGSSIMEKNAVRSQQLMSCFQLATQSAMLPGMQGKVDFPGLFMRIMKESFDLDRLEDFMIDVRTSLTVDPETENIALLEDMEVPIHNGDDDAEHMKIHDEAFDKAKNQQQKLNVLKHNEKHRMQKQAKDQLAQLQAKQQALSSVMGNQGQQGQGGPPNQGGGPSQGPVQGNVNQMPENPSEANLTRGIRGAEGNLH